MNNRKNSLRTDLAFFSIVVLSFCGTIFLMLNTASIVQNSIMLCIVCVVILLTYLTSMAVGLIANAAVIFLFLAYHLVLAARTGVPVSYSSYFWILWMPLITLAVAVYCQMPHRLQAENHLLHGQLIKLTTVDDLTELRNIRGFEIDALTYMKISKRYDMKLVLILWKFRYYKELGNAIGAQSIPEAVRGVSDAIRDNLRTEDVVYLLDDTPYLWGTLLFTNPQMTEVMVNRVKQSVFSVDLSKYTKQPPPMDLNVGVLEYQGEDITPFAFLEKAKGKLEKNTELV